MKLLIIVAISSLFMSDVLMSSSDFSCNDMQKTSSKSVAVASLQRAKSCDSFFESQPKTHLYFKAPAYTEVVPCKKIMKKPVREKKSVKFSSKVEYNAALDVLRAKKKIGKLAWAKK